MYLIGVDVGGTFTRKPERVRDDVADGLLSAKTALGDYGVVLTPSGEVDEAETARLRAGMAAVICQA
jgi:N-methylhydantoinase B